MQESEKYVAEPEDPSRFKYDENTKMWRRKTEKEINDGSEVKALTYEQNESNDSKEKVGAEVECTSGLENTAASSSEKLSSEEIDEIRKKREKYKGTKESVIKRDTSDRDKEKYDKEDGEVNSDEDFYKSNKPHYFTSCCKAQKHESKKGPSGSRAA